MIGDRPLTPAEIQVRYRKKHPDGIKAYKALLNVKTIGTGLTAQIVSVQDAQHVTFRVTAAATVTGAVRTYTDLVLNGTCLCRAS